MPRSRGCTADRVLRVRQTRPASPSAVMCSIDITSHHQARPFTQPPGTQLGARSGAAAAPLRPPREHSRPGLCNPLALFHMPLPSLTFQSSGNGYSHVSLIFREVGWLRLRESGERRYNITIHRQIHHPHKKTTTGWSQEVQRGRQRGLKRLRQAAYALPSVCIAMLSMPSYAAMCGPLVR